MTSLPEMVLDALFPVKNHRYVVAFSGGIDSTVLLHCMVTLRNQGHFRDLRGIHVHHGLVDQADQWAEHCQSLCEQWSVPCQITRVSVATGTGTGLEKSARSARYRVFEQALGTRDCLLQGHHQDDQAETLLFRLFRGTGIDGLSGIPANRPLGQGMLLRPLLSVSRSAIVDYVRKHQLTHIEDASNGNQHFSRNYIRHSLLPEIDQRWPAVASRLASLADECQAVKQQRDGMIAEQVAMATITKPQWLLGYKPLLVISQLQTMKAALRQQVIRHWLKQQTLPIPGREMLGRVFDELIVAKEEASPLMCWAGCEVRRYRGMLVAAQPHPPVEQCKEVSWDWRKELVLLDDTFGCLGVKALMTSTRQAVALPAGPLCIKNRMAIDPAMKLAVAGRKGRKTVKRWLQEYQVPPWLRQRIPFVFRGDSMICAPGVWVCEGFQAKEGAGHEVVWDVY